MDRATEYFDRQASGYLEASERWPWSWLRGSERAGVLGLVGQIPGHDLLELGSGAGYYTHAALVHGAKHVWAVDRSAEMLRQIRSDRVTTVLGDIATVQVPRTFPAILAAGVFEFVDSARDVLANAARHADDDAWLVVLYSTPNWWGRGFRYFHARHGVHIHLYRQGEFDAAAASAGWIPVDARRCGMCCIAARYRKAPR